MKQFRVFLLFCLAFLGRVAYGNHLVGGEFQITHMNNFNYQIQLNVYGDAANLGPGNEDRFVDVATFSKRTNLMVESFRIDLFNSYFVPYNNLQCQTNSIQTKVLQYQIQRYMAPGIYNDPDGYYITWDRCCRNRDIVNITNPGLTGFVFYAEFPPVGLNGALFVNSSPVLPPFPPDILCSQELYQYSLAATDPDGDRLEYSLSEPLRGTSTQTSPLLPIPNPGPYRPVDWQGGIGLNNMIPGSPALSINPTTGLLTVRPQYTGLFVFAITVSEFRNNVKIGEIRRDIQVKVNPCQSNQKPKLSLRAPGATRDYQEGDTLFVTDATDYCYPFTFSDSNVGQTVALEVIPLNFVQKPTLTPTSVTITQTSQVINGTICWADCNVNSPDVLYKVLLIARDNACGSAGTDTLELAFMVVPKPNARPGIVVKDLVNNEAEAEAEVGKTLQFILLSTDSDQDEISVSMQGIGFNTAALGMQLTPVSGQGTVSSVFTWTPGCEQFLDQKAYRLLFKAKDNSCFADHSDTVSVNVRVIELPDTEEFLPPNIFTPNNDGLNDTFVMPNLPKDNCQDRFQEIRVYSRWGNLIYESADRQFAWDGNNVSDGVYFYRIKFQKRTYKGYVTVVR